MATLLVVDDKSFMRLKCAKILFDNNFYVVEAETGDQALKMYKDNKPDGVLLDIDMPEKDGLEVLKELIKMDPNARIAMVSALGQQKIVLEALKAGAKDFVVKPFDEPRILSAIYKLLGEKPMHMMCGHLDPLQIETPWETLYLKFANDFIKRFEAVVTPNDYFYGRKAFPIAYRNQGTMALFETYDGPKEYFIINLKNSANNEGDEADKSETEYFGDTQEVQERIHRDHQYYVEISALKD